METPKNTSVTIQDLQTGWKQGSFTGINVGLLLILFICFTGISLSANNKKTRQLAATATGIDFGNVTVGSSSTQSITVTNTGNSNANISGVTVTGAGFSYGGPNLPLNLSGGQSVNLSVTFLPAAPGTATGSVSLSSNANISPSTISLTGNGVQPALTVSPTSLSFGNVLVGTGSSQTISLFNSGTGNISFSQVSVTGSGFGVSGLALPLSLAPGQSSVFTVSFLPTVTGGVTGSISVVSTAPNSPALVSLSGTGVQPQISVVPSSVSFGNVTDGLTNTQTVTISNPGSANLTVTQAIGPGACFSVSGLSLPLTVAPGHSGSFTLSFSPTAAGNSSSSVTLVSNASNSPTVIPISGTGVAPILQLSASTTSLNFGSDTVGTTSTQNVTLTNTGNSNVSVSQISVTGAGFSVSGLALPVTLSAGQTASFSVVFSPSVTGSVTGNVSVTSTATNSPLSISLSGSGVQVSHSVNLNWTASTSVVAGYNVYCGTLSGGPYTKLNSTLVGTTTYTDSTVLSGQTYYYLVTSVDSNGVESAYSNEVSATVP